MPIKIVKSSIKAAARSSNIKGFTLKEIEESLERDAIEALKESGVKEGKFYINDTGFRADAVIDSNGNLKIKTKRRANNKLKNKKQGNAKNYKSTSKS